MERKDEIKDLSREITVSGPDQAESRQEEKKVSRGQRMLLLGALLIGGCFAALLEGMELCWYVLMLASALVVFLILHRKTAKKSITGRFLFSAIMIVYAALLVLWGADPDGSRYPCLRAFGIFMLPCLMMGYAAFTAFAVPVQGEGIAARKFLQGFFVFPFVGIPRFFMAVISCFRGRGDRQRRRAVFAGIIIAVPLLALVLLLLSRADATFKSGVLSVFRLHDRGWDSCEKVLFLLLRTLLGGMFFYSFLYCTKYRQGNLAPVREQQLPTVTAGIVEGALLLVYAAFIGLQFSYLFGGTLPEAYTYSEYAVKGFSELILVSVINFLVLAVSVRYGKQGGILSVMQWLILVCQCMLLLSAADRLYLYIHAYGWTEKRLLSAWLEAYLAFLTVLTGVRLMKERFPLTRVSICTFAVWIIALFIGGIPFLRMVL